MLEVPVLKGLRLVVSNAASGDLVGHIAHDVFQLLECRRPVRPCINERARYVPCSEEEASLETDCASLTLGIDHLFLQCAALTAVKRELGAGGRDELHVERQYEYVKRCVVSSYELLSTTSSE